MSHLQYRVAQLKRRLLPAFIQHLKLKHKCKTLWIFSVCTNTIWNDVEETNLSN